MDEREFYEAQEVESSMRDIHFDFAEREARELDQKLRVDANVSNDDRAQLVYDCFDGICTDLDLDGIDAFEARFPEYGGLV